MQGENPALEGAFKTPGLRKVALRAPHPHAGQFASLEQLVARCAAAPLAVPGHSGLAHPEPARAGKAQAWRTPIRLNAAGQRALGACLHSLSGPVLERLAP